MRAADVMTRDPVTVRPDTSIRSVIELLRRHRISGLPVVSHVGGLVGVVSESDLMHKAAAWPVSPHPDFPLDRVSEQMRERAEALCVADVMTASVVSVDARTSVREVAQLMTLNHVNRVPVTQDGRLVGIVTRGDVLKVLMRPDDELQEELMARLDAARRQSPGHYVHAEVRDGVAVLWGRAPTRSEAVHLLEQIRRMEGLIGVQNEIRFDIDDVEAGVHARRSAEVPAG